MSKFEQIHACPCNIVLAISNLQCQNSGHGCRTGACIRPPGCERSTHLDIHMISLRLPRNLPFPRLASSFSNPVRLQFIDSCSHTANSAIEKASMSGVTTYTLPPLPYGYHALEPAISGQIMELHHSKHHQTYVNNLNAALANLATASRDVAAQIVLQSAIKFNGGGHINHSLFWQNLSPPSAPEAQATSAPTLSAAIKSTWGSIPEFQKAFNAALLAIQGSGWGWLIKFENEGGRLGIVMTKDQNPIVGKGQVPILGIDMWEHAYYLQYLNGKTAYVENIWSVINWLTAERRYLGGQQDAWGILKQSLL
jgi:Fe-Mn family superoxide dismutase